MPLPANGPDPFSPTVLYDLSELLETGLDRETLAILIGLTEQGVNPEVCDLHCHVSLCVCGRSSAYSPRARRAGARRIDARADSANAARGTALL